MTKEWLGSCLFSHPSFLGGMASSLDVASVFCRYNESPDENVADNVALTLDWYAVGQDLESAMLAYGR